MTSPPLPPLTPAALRVPERILIIRPSALGDVCRSVPVLASLRAAFPTARIDWLVQDTFAPAVASHPALTANGGGVVPFPRAQLKRWYAPATTPALRAFLAGLSAARYDLVLDCQGLLRSGLFALATRAPRRIGFDNAQELGWLGLTERIAAPRDLHAVDRMLLLAQAAGAAPAYDLRLYTSEADRAWAAAQPALAEPFAVLAPTTRWPGKRWAGDRFAALARGMLDKRVFGCERVVLVGAQSEREQCGELLALAAREPRVVDLIGATSVGQLMAVVERCAVLVGCDSAAVHMAVGFDRPLCALYGPTRVERVGPYNRSAQVVQRLIPGDVMDHKNEGAGRRLMDRISVEDVVECLAAQRLTGPI
jgi:lipopolysaccharide heptosyltransferase I